MTQVDFYILDEHAAGDRYQLACRIAERALRAGHRVLIHTPSNGEAQHLDRLLWTLWESAFVPHGLLGRDARECNPILIGNGNDDVEEHEVLVNLAPDVPAFFGRFQRLVECVDHDDAIKTAGRERFRYHREHGYPLSTHTIA